MYGESNEPPRRRVAATEVVEGELEAGVGQFPERGFDSVDVIVDGALVDLEADRARFEPVDLEELIETPVEGWVAEARRGQVDGDTAVRSSELGGGLGSQGEDLSIETTVESGGFDQVEELGGHDDASLRVSPPGQPLVPRDLSGLEIDDRLEPELQSSSQMPAEVGRQ